MNSADLIVLVFVAGGLIIGLFRGLIKMLSVLLSLLGSLVLLRFLSKTFYLFLDKKFPGSQIPYYSNLILLILGFVGILLFIKLIDMLIKATPLTIINRIGGAVLGATVGFLIAGFLILAQTKFTGIGLGFSTKTKSESRFYQPAIRFSNMLSPSVKYLKDLKSNYSELQ